MGLLKTYFLLQAAPKTASFDLGKICPQWGLRPHFREIFPTSLAHDSFARFRIETRFFNSPIWNGETLMTIKVNYPGPPEEAYKKIKTYIQAGKLPPQLSAQNTDWDDSEHSAILQGKGFKANISTSTNSNGSEIQFELNLNFFLKAFRQTVESQVKKHLEKALA